MEKKNKQLNFEGQKIYIGIDVHLKSWKVSVRLENIAQRAFHQEADPDQLYGYLTKHYPGGEYICAYEAGFSGFWIKEKLEQRGIRCLVAHAADIPTTDKEKKLKTDKRDSHKIARALRNDDLTLIYVPTKEQQLDRSLVRTKYMLSKDRRRVKSRIKMHLHFYGLKIPSQVSITGRWTKKLLVWLEEQSEQRSDEALKILVQDLVRLRQLELGCLRRIRQLSQTSVYKERVDLLITVPGIGVLTAMLLLTELVDIKRFGSLGQLCSYIGFIPRTHSSGEKQRVGGLTKRGRGSIRVAIIEAAWTLVRSDPALGLQYNKWAKSLKSGQKAIIKIARKLLNRIRMILIKKVAYEIGINS